MAVKPSRYPFPLFDSFWTPLSCSPHAPLYTPPHAPLSFTSQLQTKPKPKPKPNPHLNQCSSSMADAQRSKSGSGNRRQPSRLQRRAPSLQISAPVSNWNVAIPLLSPLATSPTSPKLVNDRAAETKPREDPRLQGAEAEKVAFKKWQHPAAPFCYEPAPRVRPFVPA